MLTSEERGEIQSKKTSEGKDQLIKKLRKQKLDGFQVFYSAMVEDGQNKLLKQIPDKWLFMKKPPGRMKNLIYALPVILFLIELCITL